jgi:signal transduction histidine kinase
MKQLLAGGTRGQIAAIVMISLLAAHGLSAIVWFSFHMRAGPPPEFIRPASQISLVLRLLDELPAVDHAAILASAAKDGLAVREGAGALPDLDTGGDPGASGLYHALREEPGVARQVLSAGRAAFFGTQSGRLGVVIGPVSHMDRWLLFEVDPNHDRRPMPLRWISPSGFASFVAVPLLVGLISLWAARRVASPLVRLATATAGVRVLQDPSPVTEEGALEVRQVAHAFNEMLAKLRRFVIDRTRMLAAVSHDLRTPLMRLRLRAETVNDAETRTKMLTDIRAMEAMITATLAFIREEAAQESIERMDMAVLLQTICDDFDDAGSQVRYEGPLHCAASCRPQALQRALNNLIDNAVKFGATAIVRLEASPCGIVITVEDDGPGISDAQKETVFKPFFRGSTAQEDPQNGSVGLGLSIVRAIVQSHNGQVELYDRAPSGLSVRLSIPH